MKKINVNVAEATQTAVPELGKEAKKMYYLIIGEENNKVIINVGEKTYAGVASLLKK